MDRQGGSKGLLIRWLITIALLPVTLSTAGILIYTNGNGGEMITTFKTSGQTRVFFSLHHSFRRESS